MLRYIAFIMLTMIGAQILSAPITVTSRASTGAGDVEVYNGTIYLSDLYIYMANSGPLGCSNGFYFNLSSVPKGAQITKAYITFKASGANAVSSNDNMRIYGEAADSAVVFTTATNYSARVKTIANVLWVPTPWNIGSLYNTADFTPVVQEIVSRPNWKGPIAILIASEAVGTSDRRSTAFESDPLNTALLTVEYTTTPLYPLTKTFHWTARGDDGDVGTATIYDMRYALDSATLISWTSANQITNEPLPQIAGSAETLTVTINANENTKYFFALKSADESGNWSGISNIVWIALQDTVPPGAITNFGIQ